MIVYKVKWKGLFYNCNDYHELWLLAKSYDNKLSSYDFKRIYVSVYDNGKFKNRFKIKNILYGKVAYFEWVNCAKKIKDVLDASDKFLDQEIEVEE